MKRKIFTSLAAAGLLACTIATASAASAPTCLQQQPNRICFYWQNPCFEFQLPGQEETPDMPETPIVPDAPVEPEAPELPETPIVPDVPTEPETPSVPDETPEEEVPGDDVISTISQLEQAACDLVNQQRAAYGLEPLTIDANLCVKARIKSEDMKVNNYFSHTSPTYGSPFEMMQNLGITYRTAGENIAMGYSTAEAVVNAWMNSEGHRANILSSNYTSMGIGYVDGYWTQWFVG